jgi:5-hydroxyisourate hydrolase
VSTISTHVLDTSLGRPATNVRVTLERLGADASAAIATSSTDANGRIAAFGDPGPNVAPGTYRLRFDTAEYFARTGRPVFYPEIVVSFRIEAADEHFHIPVLVSPFGYSTYRGS